MNTIHNSIEKRNYLQFDILVKQRIGVNCADGKGLTPLMKCCHEPNKKNATEMVRLLLHQQAVTKRLDRKGRNVLMHACLVGNAEIVQMLLNASYFDPAGRDYQGNAPIHYCAMSGDQPTLVLILEHMKKYRVKTDLRNDQGLTPIHIACSQCHVAAARLLHSEGDSSLTLRDGSSNRTARMWLEQVCDIPNYVDPFARDIDVTQIVPKKEPTELYYEDKSEIRLFVFMKDYPNIDQVELPDMRPPWDISTNVKTPPKYLKNGLLNPARLRPQSAQDCSHYHGTQKIRPFSAPCGYPEFSSWKHPQDMRKYLSIKDLNSLRRYSSIADLRNGEISAVVKKQAERLLATRA